jgi:AAA ATPase domain
VLVLLGEPGIGKTALCTWALEQADGMRVIAARGVELEIDIPYGALAELCAGQLDYLDSLPGPQARALEGVLARRPGAPGDRFAVGAAVLSLLSAAAEGDSALVLVDDAQWVDRSSTDALLFAGRRLREEGVAMIVAARPGGVIAEGGTALPTVNPAAVALLRRGDLERTSADMDGQITHAVNSGVKRPGFALLDQQRAPGGEGIFVPVDDGHNVPCQHDQQNIPLGVRVLK